MNIKANGTDLTITINGKTYPLIPERGEWKASYMFLEDLTFSECQELTPHFEEWDIFPTAIPMGGDGKYRLQLPYVQLKNRKKTEPVSA